MLKTNVIKTDYEFLIRNDKTKEEMKVTINAESIEAAMLKIQDGWTIVQEDE